MSHHSAEQKDQFHQALNLEDPAKIADACRELQPATIADFLRELTLDRSIFVLQALPVRLRAAVFGNLSLETQREIATLLEPQELADLVVAMPHDERADLVQKLTNERAEGLLRLIAKTEREDIRRLSQYPKGTAGSVMTSDYATLPLRATAEEALNILRTIAPDSETIDTAYVLDEQRRLIGYVRLRDLILASPKTPVQAIMVKDVPYVRAEDSKQKAAQLLSKYDMEALPVINGGDALVGIVTFDDALDVAEEGATESIHKLGGSNLRDVDLRVAPVLFLVQKRVPWLLVLVFMNIFSGAGIAHFEDTITSAVALVFFLPLLIDSGGNAGSQSATLMVRSLALGDVRMGDWFRLLRKEVGVALIMGLIMGIGVATIGMFRGGPDIAIVVAMSMVCIVLVGCLIGMSLPFLLTRFGFDPATASAPLITSIADICGVLIYFSIATWYLDIGSIAG
jgi:magnesium transporter